MISKSLFALTLFVSGACEQDSQNESLGAASSMLAEFDRSQEIYFRLRSTPESPIPVNREMFEGRWDIELGYRCRGDCPVQLRAIRRLLASASDVEASCPNNVVMTMEFRDAERVSRYYIDASGQCIEGSSGALAISSNLYEHVRTGARSIALR